MESVKMVFEDFCFIAEYKGGKPSSWDNRNTNYHKVDIVNLKTGAHTWFEYWCSIIRPRIETETDLLEAVDCFLNDAIAGSMTYTEFCDEFGYEPHEKETKKVYNNCQKATEKFDRVFDGYDLYDISEAIRTKIEEE